MKINNDLKEKLSAYALAILESNKRFNLTGHSTVEAIYQNLILKSIVPLSNIDVPRGTSCIDLGSGSGIPGIPIALYFPDLHVTLIEVNEKKSMFLKNIVSRLSINNISVQCSRAEEIALKPDYREQYSLLLSRAFQNLYITLEIGASFIKIGGLLYVYSNQTIDDLSEQQLCHIELLGLLPLDHIQHERFCVDNSGLLFKKNNSTPAGFPRRYSIMKKKSKIIME